MVTLKMLYQALKKQYNKPRSFWGNQIHLVEDGSVLVEHRQTRSRRSMKMIGYINEKGNPFDIS